jgi:hypothetical protein
MALDNTGMERSARFAVGLLAFLLVCPLAIVAYFAVVVIPSWADVETFCLLDAPTSHAADVYAVFFLIAIAVTGIAVIGLMVVCVDRIRWRFVVTPLAWVGAILLAEYLVALAISPQPCQGGIGI